jgi:eukaryotic-like serine/threonine-protein kinase
MINTHCPGQDDLAAFTAGRMPGAALEHLAAHVQQCAACQARLEAMDRGRNSVLSLLRREPMSDVNLPTGGGQPSFSTLGPPTTPGPEAIRAGTVVPADAVTAPARANPLAAGVTPLLESEIAALLHFRLRVLVTVTLVALLFLLLENVADPLRHTVTQRAWDWRDQGLLIVTILAHAAVGSVLWWRRRLSLKRLRVLEVCVLVSATAYLAGNRYITLAAAGIGVSSDPAAHQLHVEHAMLLSNMGWFFAMASYGLYIPNTWRRCAAVIASLAFVALLMLILAAQANPMVAARLPMLLGASLTGLVLVGGLALFGSFKLSSLQREAFAARQAARELGQYRLTRKLGSGGMGEVHLAEHRLLKRACAIKLIRPQHADDPEALRRFEREVQATAQLRHPHIVEIYDYGHAADGTFYYVMEHLSGMTLSDVVLRHGPMPPARAVHVLRQLCSALRSAHGIGLIHRDIKPSNAMLCPDGIAHDRVKLLDFGLVRAVGVSETANPLTQEGVVIGTPEYMSPEQAEGRADMDGRSDLYSLGAVAYFLLTGTPPFRGRTPVQMVLAHLHTPVTPMRTCFPNIPEDVEAVVLRCLAKSPAERFADIASLERALDDCACAGLWDEEQAAAWWRAVAEARPEQR